MIRVSAAHFRSVKIQVDGRIQVHQVPKYLPLEIYFKNVFGGGYDVEMRTVNTSLYRGPVDVCKLDLSIIMPLGDDVAHYYNAVLYDMYDGVNSFITYKYFTRSFGNEICGEGREAAIQLTKKLSRNEEIEAAYRLVRCIALAHHKSAYKKLPKFHPGILDVLNKNI